MSVGSMIKRIVEYRAARTIIDTATDRQGSQYNYRGLTKGSGAVFKDLVKEFFKLPEGCDTTGKKIQAITGMIFCAALVLFPICLLLYVLIAGAVGFLKNNITW